MCYALKSPQAAGFYLKSALAVFPSLFSRKAISFAVYFEINMMKWEQLLSAKRWGSEDKYNSDPTEARSEFQRDYDRLIF